MNVNKQEQGQVNNTTAMQDQGQGQGQGQQGQGQRPSHEGGEPTSVGYEEALHQLAECDAITANLIDESLLMEMEAATVMVDMISMNDALIFKHLEDSELELVTEIGLKKFSDNNKKD